MIYMYHNNSMAMGFDNSIIIIENRISLLRIRVNMSSLILGTFENIR